MVKINGRSTGVESTKNRLIMSVNGVETLTVLSCSPAESTLNMEHSFRRICSSLASEVNSVLYCTLNYFP